MGRGSGSRGLALVVVAALCVVGPLASAAMAGSGGSGTGNDVLATLQINSPGVQVRKSDVQQFKDAKDGQKLREGDTVKTDATGKAEIDYSDDAYTRLDVNTTFTITKLTEEEGDRQVEGSLEEGRTWNRTAAVTESGSFEQSGAGATAAVVGTAFMVQCPTSDECIFTAVEHDIRLTGDGEVHLLTPRDQCDSTSGDLCDDPVTLTVDQMAAITWIQENLFRDLVERGVGDGPFVPSFTVVVEDGQIVSVVENPPAPPPPPPPPSGPTTTTTTPTTVPKYIDEQNPVIVDPDSEEIASTQVTIPTGPQPRIVTEDETGPIEFKINVTAPSGQVIQIVFTALPSNPQTFGAIKYYDASLLPGDPWKPVEQDVPYGADTLFHFAPVQLEPGEFNPPYNQECNQSTPTTQPVTFDDCWPKATFPNSTYGPEPGTVQWSQTFTIKAVNVTTGTPGNTVTVPIVVIDDICAESPGPNRVACDLLEEEVGQESVGSTGGTSIAPLTPSTTLPPSTTTTTTTLPPVEDTTTTTVVPTE